MFRKVTQVHYMLLPGSEERDSNKALIYTGNPIKNFEAKVILHSSEVFMSQRTLGKQA